MQLPSKLMVLRKLTSVVQPYLHEPEVGGRLGLGGYFSRCAGLVLEKSDEFFV